MFDIFGSRWKQQIVPADQALPGRADPIVVAEKHFVLGGPMVGPWPSGHLEAWFGMGCFWGAEKLFWQLEGVTSTAVGFAAGHTENPSYEEVCSGQTGHNEVVQVVWDPAVVRYAELLRVFWEGHDPTQGMRQGADSGTQYRSGVYCATDEQLAEALASREAYAAVLAEAGYRAITTEVLPAGAFYYAEDYHQQYLAKNPGGYCGIGGTGVSCPIGLRVEG